MGWFSKLFSRDASRPPKEVRAIFEKMGRLLDDDDAQLDMLGEPRAAMFREGESCDQIPGGTGAFGFTETNPIPVNGPIGQLSYLSKLRTLDGQRLFFHRVGSMANMVDLFEAVDFSGKQWFWLYLHMYHPRKSRLAPQGLSLSNEISQFTGFTSRAENFPMDFVEMKARQAQSGLNMLYLPATTARKVLGNAVFERPADHVNR